MSITKKLNKKSSTYKVLFTLPTEALPQANEVRVLGEFNDWSWENGVVMKAGKKEFKAEIELIGGKNYEFRYLADNMVWENDWSADDYKPVSFADVYNSVVMVPEIKSSLIKKKTPKKITKAFSLTIIEGIGPKISKVLIEAGYDSFQKLSLAKKAELEEVLISASKRYKMFDPTTWPKQAKLASAEKWDELKKLQDKLDGGKSK